MFKYFPEWKGENFEPFGCKLQKQENNTIAIFGDSHAERLFYGLSEIYSQDKNNGVEVFSAIAQSPFINLRTSIKNIKNDNRYQLIKKAYKYVFEDPNIKYVILSHFPLMGVDPNLGAEFIEDIDNTNIIDIYRKAMIKTFDALKRNKK